MGGRAAARRAVAVMRAKMSVAAVDRRASERFRPRTSGEGARKPSARRSRRDERAGGERSCSGRFRPAQKQNCRLLLFLRPSSRPSGAVVRAKSAASKISLTPASLLLLRRRAPRAAAPLTSKTPAKTERGRERERGSKEKGEGDDVRKMSTSFSSRGGEEGKNEDAFRPSCN